MVELQIESLSTEDMPKDCFVSVRVGETQKLSRLGSQRNYRFPQAGNRRFGKIEVFRRIGAASIDLDPATHGLREVSISCEGAGFGSLGLKIGVEGDGKAGKALEEPQKPGKPGMQAAKEYLSKHSLEVRLSEAMQAVLRQRPEDPVAFLANRLLGGPGAAKAAPKPPAQTPEKAAKAAQKQTAAAGPGVAVLPFGAYCKQHFQSVGKEAFAVMHARFPGPKRPASLAVAQVESTVAPKQAAATMPSSFAAYYRGAFASVAAGDLAKVYTRFPAFTAAAKKAPKQAAATAPSSFAAYYRGAFASVGTGDLAKVYTRFPAFTAATKKAPKQAAATTPSSFAAYYRGAFASVGTGDLAKVYTRFPAFSSAAAKKASARPAAEAVASPSFRMRPSVGTWLASRPSITLAHATAAPAAAAAAAVPAADAAPTGGFKMRPSVGTWLAARPSALRTPPAAGPATTPVSTKPAPTPAAATEAPALAFVRRPSVGTWLMQRSAAVAVPRADALRQLRGLRAANVMSPDERCEAERVLSKAFLELTGELAGDYYPLATSASFPAKPGGMSAAEAGNLGASGFLFAAVDGDASGRGVFATFAGDAAAWVNEAGHVRFIVLQGGAEGLAKLARLEGAVAAALKQDGYEMA